MSERPAFLDNSIVIAAHPDDELLWFNAILRDVDEVLIVYREFWAQPALGPARAAALADYPRDGVTCLDIAESGAHGCGNWQAPEPNEYGIAFTYEASRRALTRLARKALPKVGPIAARQTARANVSSLYRRNFEHIRDSLRPRLAPDMNVFTHNPWGEYGHEEHIQVFRVLETLREEIGFRLWMSNYCTDRAMALAQRYFETCPGGYIRLPTDKAFADTVADVYKKHDCWTWADDWSWFEEECFMEAPRSSGPALAHQHLFPLNFFTIDPQRARSWPPVALTMSAASAAVGVTLSKTLSPIPKPGSRRPS